jgi:hypothetical protein
MNSQESITIFITYLLRYLYLIHRDSNIYLDILYLHTIYYSSFIKRVIFMIKECVCEMEGPHIKELLNY